MAASAARLSAELIASSGRAGSSGASSAAPSAALPSSTSGRLVPGRVSIKPPLRVTGVPVKARTEKEQVSFTSTPSLIDQPRTMAPERYGKYNLLERIGVGGMAEVWRAKTLGAEGFTKDLVIKRILPKFTGDEESVRMFIDEARLVAKMHHPNIVQIFDFDKEGDRYYLAMELVEGRDLRQAEKSAAKAGVWFPVPMSVYLIAEALKGLHYAHTRLDHGKALEIVHRDVSPHNILISFSGDVKISDFGIAKVAERASSATTGTVKGKLAYMSPEQITGQPLDGRTDIYSMGIVFWELLTRHRLFFGPDEHDVIRRVRDGIVPPPRQYNPEIPEEVEKIVLKMLVPNRAQRYQSAGEVARHLTAVAQYQYEAQSLGEFMRTLFPEKTRNWTKVLQSMLNPGDLPPGEISSPSGVNTATTNAEPLGDTAATVTPSIDRPTPVSGPAPAASGSTGDAPASAPPLASAPPALGAGRGSNTSSPPAGAPVVAARSRTTPPPGASPPAEGMAFPGRSQTASPLLPASGAANLQSTTSSPPGGSAAVPARNRSAPQLQPPPGLATNQPPGASAPPASASAFPGRTAPPLQSPPSRSLMPSPAIAPVSGEKSQPNHGESTTIDVESILDTHAVSEQVAAAPPRPIHKSVPPPAPQPRFKTIPPAAGPPIASAVSPPAPRSTMAGSDQKTQMATEVPPEVAAALSSRQPVVSNAAPAHITGARTMIAEAPQIPSPPGSGGLGPPPMAPPSYANSPGPLASLNAGARTVMAAAPTIPSPGPSAGPSLGPQGATMYSMPAPSIPSPGPQATLPPGAMRPSAGPPAQLRPAGLVFPTAAPTAGLPPTARWVIGPVIALAMAMLTAAIANRIWPPAQGTVSAAPSFLAATRKLTLIIEQPGATVQVDGTTIELKNPKEAEVKGEIGKTAAVRITLDGYEPYEGRLLFTKDVRPPLRIKLFKPGERQAKVIDPTAYDPRQGIKNPDDEDPSKVEKTEPVKVEKPEPVKVEKPEPVKVEKPEPADTDGDKADDKKKHRKDKDKDKDKDKGEKKVKATLTVTVRPWAIVFVDGKKIQQTPMRDYALSAGSHTLILENTNKGKREVIKLKVTAGEKIPTINRVWE